MGKTVIGVVYRSPNSFATNDMKLFSCIHELIHRALVSWDTKIIQREFDVNQTFLS